MWKGSCKYCGTLITSPRCKITYCSGNCLFDTHVKKQEGCWCWKGPTNPAGYGKVNKPKPAIYAHRFSYLRFKGPIPIGLCVLHKCDNPPCTNPEHLFLGTLADNVRDCIGKKRNSAPPRVYGKNNVLSKNLKNRLGENHHSAKLTESDVRSIRASKELPKKLSEKYGVNRQIIWKIRKRMIWKRVHL